MVISGYLPAAGPQAPVSTPAGEVSGEANPGYVTFLDRARSNKREAGVVRKTLVWLGVAALVGAAALPAAAATAPSYVTSSPANGATVSSAPDRVSITFSEPLDESSTLQVFDECGRAVDAGDKQVLGSRIDVGIAQRPAGHYTAVYVAKGFAGATGETKGSISFHVTSGDPCDGSDDGHGGHGGHGGSGGNGDGGEDGHGGHGGGEGGGHDEGDGDHDDGDDHDDGGDHDDGDHGGGGDHSSGGDHGDGDHGGDQGHGDGHGSGSGGAHGGSRHGNGHGAGDRDASRGGPDDPQLASGRGGPGLAPTSTSVVIALALSVAMGALGGWVLRVSAAS
jgi:methionine-rich copper-binding protein CopC